MTDETHPWDVPTSESLGRHETGWTPRYEQGIPSDRPFNSQPETDNDTWTTAPSTSHISRFKFVDARTNSLMRKFGRRLGRSEGNPFTAGASQLHVVFKGKQGVGEDSEYAYFFTDHQLGADLYERLKTSGHPYSEVLRPDVVLNKSIPYQRLSSLT